MKKNFFLIASLAVAALTTSCDNSGANNNVVTADESTAAATETSQPVIENPNVASEETNAVASADAPVMAFEETEYDFGTIKQGEVVEHTFAFTNTGKSPLVIESASATCGCTAPEPPKEPIAPGEKSSIKVKFNSAGKMGQQYPTVTVRANTEPNIVKISMKGNVETSNIPTAGAEGPVRRN
ncbi:DUF1573 domain-containing protein [Pontibacter silvestris]|uniref:DUF1573 domain-containing protein n=1 Tax=Pontibacter silvestris TaxID=2305183 RepID=A0ABW4WYD3_9BACT|nr:DUF1573 domain-containing protein [Pontibacter silvestris]MCC9136630.1 DUF1573 domain-containing protein [Pontibacter silvestris]